MSGPQFAHVQTWSRKSNAAGQSVNQVIGEATRVPEFSTHVDSPAPPRVLLGNPVTFAADHAAHVAARSTSVIMPDGSVKSRSIRTDRHTMASIVMSYPVPRSTIITEEAKAKLAAWEARNLKWLREKYGSQLRVVLAHDDETQPHLHAWLLPDDPGADATTLHPGKVAKKAVEAQAKADGEENRVAVKLGNKALRAAMTLWQDEYHAAVGAPEGLTRSGPRRRRLTRAQWQAEKATAQAHKAALERAERATEHADAADIRIIAAEARGVEIKALEAKMLERATRLQTLNDSVKLREALVAGREGAVERREGAVERREREILTGLDKAKREALEASSGAARLRADTEAECLEIRKQAQGDFGKISRLVKMVRDLVVRIGSKLGLDLLGKDLMTDLEGIETALSEALEASPQADQEGPDF
jgi:hypothetical protein